MKYGSSICAFVALAACAAGAAAAEPAHPADPAAAVPAPRYESAFSTYRPYRDEKPASWRDLNDEVARVGGHIGVLRAGDSASPATSPAAGYRSPQ